MVDLDGALKLVDKSQITVDEQGNVSGVEQALESLKTNKAYLFNNTSGTSTNVGAANNGGTSTTGATGRYKYKESQLTPQFYKENEKDILDAYSKGLVEPDGPPR